MLTGRMGSDPDSRLPLRSRSVSLTAAAREGSEPAQPSQRGLISVIKSTQSNGVRCTLRRSECTIQCNAESVLLYIVLANAQYSKSVECRKQALPDEASQSDQHTYNTERRAFEVANGNSAT